VFLFFDLGMVVKGLNIMFFRLMEMMSERFCVTGFLFLCFCILLLFFGLRFVGGKMVVVRRDVNERWKSLKDESEMNASMFMEEKLVKDDFIECDVIFCRKSEDK
jgi:hypothetical protein